MAHFEFDVNGKSRRVESDPARPLLDVLREDLQLTGAKYGCGEGMCRACTVLMDGKPITSCLTPVERAQGKKITTVEALAENGALHPVQAAFLEEGAMQCGYCIPGMILRTIALLEEHPKPTGAQIVDGLNGNICRCCGYPRIIAAVQRASELAERSGTPRKEVTKDATL